MKRRRNQTIRIFNSSSHRSAIRAPFPSPPQKLVNNKYIGFSMYEETLVDAITNLPGETVTTYPDVNPPLLAKHSNIAKGCSEEVNAEFIATYFYLLQKLCKKSALIMDMGQTLVFRKEFLNRKVGKKNNFIEKILRWSRTRELLSYPDEYKIAVMAYPTGSHWFLVIGNREARCIEIYDSLPGAGGDHYQDAVDIMVDFLDTVYVSLTRMKDVGEILKYETGCKPYRKMWHTVSTQPDFTSCGIFTVLFARYRCMNLEFDFSDKTNDKRSNIIDIEYFRKLLLLEVYYSRIPYVSTNLEEDDWDQSTLLGRKPSLIRPIYPRVYESGYFGKRAWKITIDRDGQLSFSSADNIWEILGREPEEEENPIEVLRQLTDISNVSEAVESLGYTVYRPSSIC